MSCKCTICKPNKWRVTKRSLNFSHFSLIWCWVFEIDFTLISFLFFLWYYSTQMIVCPHHIKHLSLQKQHHHRELITTYTILHLFPHLYENLYICPSIEPFIHPSAVNSLYSVIKIVCICCIYNKSILSVCLGAFWNFIFKTINFCYIYYDGRKIKVGVWFHMVDGVL